jgi:hypothetical protein
MEGMGKSNHINKPNAPIVPSYFHMEEFLKNRLLLGLGPETSVVSGLETLVSCLLDIFLELTPGVFSPGAISKTPKAGSRDSNRDRRLHPSWVQRLQPRPETPG